MCWDITGVITVSQGRWFGKCEEWTMLDEIMGIVTILSKAFNAKEY